MKLKLLNIDSSKTDTIEVSDKLINQKVNHKLIKYVVDWQLNHSKPRTAKTKQKNEIKGSTAKIYAQKGTGNARHASRKAPIFVGGGVAHGPKGESNYRIKKLNKSEKKLSIAALISEKKKDNNLLIFKDFTNEIKKTKEMYNILKKFKAENSLIILDKTSKEKVYKSMRNISNVKVTDINHFSSYDLIKYNKVIFTSTSIKDLEKRYA